MTRQLICVGEITTAHGIKGEVKITSFTEDPFSIGDYAPLYGADGTTEYRIALRSNNPKKLIASVEGISTRNEAELLSKTKLYINRDTLPEADEEEFYYEDLVGMEARLENGDILGKVTSVYNFGAGDMLEVRLKETNKDELFSFTKEIVPHINMNDGFVTISPPEITLVQSEETPENKKDSS